MTMRAAIERFVRDGMSIAMSCSLEPLVPFAAGHEIIRQGRRDLNLIAPISDSLFDQLVGAGCARRVTAAWVGNVSEGLGHNYRRAAERAEPLPLEIHDHSNFSVSLALWAAAWGAPFIPTRTLLGSDILRSTRASAWWPAPSTSRRCGPTSRSSTSSAPTPRAAPTAGDRSASPRRPPWRRVP